MKLRKKAKKEPTKQELMERLFLGKTVINVKEDLRWGAINLELNDGTLVTLKGSGFSIYWYFAEDRMKELKEKIQHGECDVNEKKAELVRLRTIAGEYNATQHSSKKKA